MNREVAFIRCDNAGENVKIKERITEEDISGIKMEYMAPETPQHNGEVERSFAFLYNRVRAMLNHAGVTV